VNSDVCPAAGDTKIHISRRFVKLTFLFNLRAEVTGGMKTEEEK
jgi:hypothetical protein